LVKSKNLQILVFLISDKIKNKKIEKDTENPEEFSVSFNSCELKIKIK